MKRSAAALLFSLLPVYSFADDCPMVAELAKIVMNSRQEGLPMPDNMKLVGGTKFYLTEKGVELFMGEEGNELFTGEDIVIKAYELPRYSTNGMKTQSTGDFRDEWYLTCVKASRS